MNVSIPEDVRLELFERAFSDGGGRALLTCVCGKRYYNADDKSIDWEPGELERMESDKNTSGVMHSIGAVSFEGRDYVDVCDCWKKRAGAILTFIEGHIAGIAAYINARKKSLIDAANSAPSIDGEIN